MDKGLTYFARLLFSVIFLLLPHICDAAPPIWIDIPDDNYEEIAEFDHYKLKDLTLLSKNYHSIPKDNELTIQTRINSLEGIVSFLEGWLSECEQDEYKYFIINVFNIASNKMKYLKALNEIAEKRLYENDFLTHYHLDYQSVYKNYKPIFLCNRRRYDSFNGQYWGEYWMESIDPCHRQLTPFLELFRNSNTENQSLLDFFLWLETQNLSKDVPYLNFLDSKELNQHLVIVNKGLLCHKRKGKLELINYFDDIVEYIFNIDLSGQLFLIPASKTVHHVSISYGKPVLGCGNLVVKEGKILSIQLESGHYLPTIQDGLQLIQLLQDFGVLLEPNVSFSFYEKNKKYTMKLQKFVQLYKLD